MNELSFLLPHFLKEGRGTIDVYFTRVYNPVWTNPDGMSWIEVLTDESLIGLHVALTPTWNETAYLADYVLPMGLASERHDIHSYEQYGGQWIGFRQPVLRAARERLGQKVSDTREVNPGEVWEENEFWIELSWRIDPDGTLGIRRYHEAPDEPGRKLTVDDYYGWIFENSVPGLPEKAAAEGLTPAGVHAPLRCLRDLLPRRAGLRRAGPGRRAGRRGDHRARPGLLPEPETRRRSTWPRSGGRWTTPRDAVRSG